MSGLFATKKNDSINKNKNEANSISIKKQLLDCNNEIIMNNNSKEKIKEMPIESRKIRKINKMYKKKGIKSNHIHHIDTNQENNKKKKSQNKININRFNPQINENFKDMDYNTAIIYDKRSFLRMFWAFLLESQIILGTFFTDNYLNLFTIKLSFLIYTFEISFFLNALFYTDDYISDAYHNNGVLDLISGLPKSIYSSILTLITTNLLKILSNSENELQKLINEKRAHNNYINLLNMVLKKLGHKLIIFFILEFILGIFFSYYVTAFCAVYRYSQKYWFIGCLESFIMDLLFSFIISMILSLLRYVSISKKIKVLYQIANFINIFL